MAMDRPIAYDKLAREDRFVRMRTRDVASNKIDQGLPPFPDLSNRESMRDRVHGILVGELQAMEGAGRTVYDFPDAPWEFTMDMAGQVDHVQGAAGVGRVAPRGDLSRTARSPRRLRGRVPGDDATVAVRLRRGCGGGGGRRPPRGRRACLAR